MKCEACKRNLGRYSFPKLHHIIPEWFHEPTKRVILCERCHPGIHAFYNKEALKTVFKLDKKFFNKCFKKFQILKLKFNSKLYGKRNSHERKKK